LPSALPDEATIDELSARMASGALTSSAHVDDCLRRIEAIDRAGPALRSVIETNPDAPEIARRLDDERRVHGARGPLHGIAVLLKDNLDTGDRMLTTAGSFALADKPAPRDSHVAEKLRAAGMVLLGKTNLSEWANFRGEDSTSGWSARGGLTKNPYALDRNPSGSSSGSAVAVAANLAPAAIGTETMGSIMGPSAHACVVGVKPTVGLVSRGGIIPISSSLDTAGPMTRTVRDAALILQAMVGPDPRDPATAEIPSTPDVAKHLDRGGLRGARLGVVRKLDWLKPDHAAVFEGALADMKGLGAVLVDVALPDARSLYPLAKQIMIAELGPAMNSYLEARGAGPRSLADLVRFNREHAHDELRWFGQEWFERAAQMRALDATYEAALAKVRRAVRDEGIDAALSANRLDALVGPTCGLAWVTDLVNGDHFTGALPHAALAGYPSITVPSGIVRGLPTGLSIFGGAWSEPSLFRLAFAYEQATHHRRPPTFARTVG
jgi:amidase